jgi:4-amino-4-deoxy-L-arabinose transferase-like glycosyltransferase
LDLLERRNIRESSASARDSATPRIPISAILIVLLTACLSLVQSHYRLLFRDEFWEMWTDRVSSIGQIVGIQLTNSVALDPLAYHVLGHTFIQAFGANTFAIRLPALLSVLVMQVCLFVFVRRIATERTAVFAMGFSALTCVMGYSMEGRPYGLLLACFGVAMVCWQTAAHREKRRTLSLVTLSAAVAIALNTQYFGVLLLGPLCAAELFRIFERKRLDLPMISSLAAGSAAVVLALPFLKAAREFRTPYGVGFLSPKAIIWSYIWTLANHTGTKFDRVIFAFVSVVVSVSLWAFGRQLRRKALSSYKPEEAFLIALAALPFFGYAVALFTLPVLEPRFVIGVVIGISALTALGLFSLSPSDRYEKLSLSALFLTMGSIGITHIWLEHRAAMQMLDSMKLQPEIKAALTTGSDQRL